MKHTSAPRADHAPNPRAAQREREQLRIRRELRAAQEELSSAYREFDEATDPDLIACCIYQINAVKARYNYLLRAFKAC